MTLRRRGRFGAWALELAMMCILCISSPASAHHALRPTTVRCFFKVEQNEAHLVVRLPISVLETVGFSFVERQLDIPNAGPAIQSVLDELRRDITIEEDGRPLVSSRAIGRLSLPSDLSFDDYEQAARHVAQPMPPGMIIYVDQGYLDAHISYPIGSPDARFAFRSVIFPELGDYLKLSVRYIPHHGLGRTITVAGQSGIVQLDPRWRDTVADFVVRGVTFALSNVEYSLFLVCLIIPFHRLRGLVPAVATTAVAHSTILLGSGYEPKTDSLWWPVFIQTATAASIVCMSLGNMMWDDRRRPLLMAGFAGLVFGLQFSTGFRDNLQFAGLHPLISLISFNVGIELGQLTVVLVAFLALAVLKRYVFVGRIGMMVLLAISALTAWPWMLERGELLWRARRSILDPSGVWRAGLLLALLVAVGLIISLLTYLRSRNRFRLEQLRRPPAPSAAQRRYPLE